MVKFDLGSVLTLIAVVLLVLVVVMFMIIKFRTEFSNRLISASMYETPTWTEVADNE